MNILFIGPYRQPDGWGNAAYDYVKALLRSKHNITARPAFLTPITRDEDEIDDEIIKAEQNIQSKYDMVIQNVLPNLFVRFPDIINVGLFYVETNSIRNSSWIQRINSMLDQVWVCSEWEKNNLQRDGISIPVRCIPMPIDVERYETKYECIPKMNIGDNFTFYFIGEYIQRKNIQALVTAFHTEFETNEPVELVIKTNAATNQNILQIIQKDMAKIKTMLRLYRNMDLYKPVHIIPNRVSEKELYELHTTGHCFVMPSSGEACCRPALDAMGFGSPVIANKHTGLSQFINVKQDDRLRSYKRNGWLVESRKSPICITDPPIPEIFNARNTWNIIDVMDLRRTMRIAFTAYANRDKDENHNGGWYDMVQNAKDQVQQHSYDSIGEVISDVYV